jgi:hypothetical protein
MFGKIGQKPIERKLNVQGQGSQWNRTTSEKGIGSDYSSNFTKWCPLFSLKHLVPYFNVSSKEIGWRIIHSLHPFNPRFHSEFHAKPDLYGPFWILTSLIVTLFIAGNISRYVKVGKDKFEYNFTIVPIAASIIYGLGIGLPLLIHFCVKFFGNNVQSSTPIVNAIGIYGYSFTSFLLISMLCAVPKNWLQWLLISYAAITSVGYLIKTYWNELKENLDAKVRWIAIGLICAV